MTTKFHVITVQGQPIAVDTDKMVCHDNGELCFYIQKPNTQVVQPEWELTQVFARGAWVTVFKAPPGASLISAAKDQIRHNQIRRDLDRRKPS